MGDRLRESTPLRQLAESGQVIEVSAKIVEFKRLVASIEQGFGAQDDVPAPGGWHERAVRGELVFGYLAPRDDAVVLAGRVETDIPAICQRCLEAFDYPLVADLRWVFQSPEAPQEREGYESWELAGPEVRPADIVDESLVMSMPFAAKHAASADCRPGEEIVDDGMTRPFASLRAQMEDEQDS